MLPISPDIESVLNNLIDQKRTSMALDPGGAKARQRRRPTSLLAALKKGEDLEEET